MTLRSHGRRFFTGKNLIVCLLVCVLMLAGCSSDKAPQERSGQRSERQSARESSRRSDKEEESENTSPSGEEESEADVREEREAVGASFAGDWEGMTMITNASGSHEGLEVSGDWIFATYARIIIDDSGNAQMDMVGVMRNAPLNYSITGVAYNADSDRLGVDGMVAGGDFHVVLDAPGEDGVIKIEGRTGGDIKADYVCYLKRLDSDWSRSDASRIPDREYIMYVENNMPLDRGLTIEERVAAAAQAGIVVDMSDFLPAQQTQQGSWAEAFQTGGNGNSGGGGGGAAPAAGDDPYVNTGKDFSIDTADLPAGYPLVAYSRFEEAFRAIVNGQITTASSYEDVAALFGDDGIRMEGIVYAGYAYYGWYSDKDYTNEHKVHILVTFRESGGKLTYYAYSSTGITPQDVK
ncbi:MAG: hypothetical protein IJQ12_09215 [Lachnospiraceae bacterium]|nr:hypothetical protein [Lachnospiraceae bacterium]